MGSRRKEPFADGADLDTIVRYVLRHTRMTEPNARHAVLEVLNLGVSMGKIGRTSTGSYVLTATKPAAVTQRIREPNFEDDSSSDASAGTDTD